MRRLIFIIIVLGIIAGGVFVFIQLRNQRASQALANFQTESVRKGSLTATVGATGTVRSNQTALLTWLTSGTVGDVTVQDGDRVVKNQELATLLQTSLPQNVILAQAELVNAEKSLENLQNSPLPQARVLQALEEAQNALEDLLNSDSVKASRVQDVADAEKAVEDAQEILDNLKDTARQSDIDAAKAQVVLAQDRLNEAKEDFEPYENKPETNLTRALLQTQLASAQKAYDDAVRRLNNLLGTADEIDIAIAEANLTLAQARLADARRNLARDLDGPSSGDIAFLEAQLVDAQREYQRLENGPDPDDIKAAEARIAAAQASLDLAFILAPFDGTITDVQIKTGDLVAPGTPAFRLDDLSHILVDVQVSEVDVNRIKVGQTVSLTFDAILAKEYRGRVVEVDLVGNTQQGAVNFNVTVEIENADEDVKTGMTAAVNITVSELSDVLLVPNRAVRIREGKRVVYVSNGGPPEPVEITLGASSETDSEVIDGELQPGDLVVLNPPAEPIFFGPPGPGRGGPGGQ